MRNAMDRRGHFAGPLGFGAVTSYTMGGFIHALLVIAIVVVLINVIQGRKVL